MKIRVLHVLETMKSGGVENRRLSLAKMLDKSEFEQKIVCTQAIGQLPVKINEAGVEVIQVGLFKSILQFNVYKKLLRVIRQFKPHIIHGAVFEGVTMAAVTGTLARVPIIIVEETSDPQNRSKLASLLLRQLARPAKAVVAVSPAVESYLLQVAKIPARKVRLINNGIFFPPLPQKEEVEKVKLALGIGESDFVIGSVGRLRDFHKRFSDLIKALPLLKAAGVLNVKLLIVGEGNDRGKLADLAGQLGVANQVVFAGFADQTALYYAMMHVFAIASFMEAFGLVAAEAMYFKLPVVATAVGGLKHIVVHGQTGLLVNKEAPHEIADAISTLYYDADKRSAFGQAGFERVLSEYSAEAYVKNVTALYKSFNLA